MRARALEQVFIERKSGVYELLLVLESVAGSRERVSLPTPARDEAGALDYLLAYLRQNGYDLARKLRVRRNDGGGLVDAPELVERLRAADAAKRGRHSRWD